MTYTLETYDPDADFDRWYTLECGREIVERMQRGPRRVLEIGCATGLMTTVLAHAGRRILACSLDREMIERARARDLPLVEFVCGDVMDFKHMEFDAIVCASVLHEVPSVRSMLLKCHELLAPRGQIFVTVPSADSLHYDGETSVSDRALRFGVRRSYGMAGWHTLLADGTGLRVVYERAMMLKPYPNDRMACLAPWTLEYLARYRGVGGAIGFFELEAAW